MITYDQLGKHLTCERGSAEWLINKEILFGGFVKNVERRKVSSYDPRTEAQIQKGGMTGGDRMYHHGYAQAYSMHISPFLPSSDITLVEVGILKGTGLAIWSELFPNGRIIGLDIDLSHTRNNLENLKRRGAFSRRLPELYEFDQFVDNNSKLESILNGQKINIFIDDGFHSDESILTTFQSVLNHLAQDFVCFIEDNDQVHTLLAQRYPEFTVLSYDRLTVIKSKSENPD